MHETKSGVFAIDPAIVGVLTYLANVRPGRLSALLISVICIVKFILAILPRDSSSVFTLFQLCQFLIIPQRN
jgi:hypothetical protein